MKILALEIDNQNVHNASEVLRVYTMTHHNNIIHVLKHLTVLTHARIMKLQRRLHFTFSFREQSLYEVHLFVFLGTTTPVLILVKFDRYSQWENRIHVAKLLKVKLVLHAICPSVYSHGL